MKTFSTKQDMMYLFVNECKMNHNTCSVCSSHLILWQSIFLEC